MTKIKGLALASLAVAITLFAIGSTMKAPQPAGTYQVHSVSLFETYELLGDPYEEPVAVLNITRVDTDLCTATDKTHQDSHTYFLAC